MASVWDFTGKKGVHPDEDRDGQVRRRRVAQGRRQALPLRRGGGHQGRPGQHAILQAVSKLPATAHGKLVNDMVLDLEQGEACWVVNDPQKTAKPPAGHLMKQDLGALLQAAV